MKVRIRIRPTVVLLLCLGAVPVLAATAPAPKVIFIGDTAAFAPAFASHPNWINKPSTPQGGLVPGGADSLGVRDRFQSDVVSQHPASVVILVGSSDLTKVRDSTENFWLDNYIQNVTAMIQEANAANIKVILGTEGTGAPLPLGYPLEMRQINAWLENYGSLHGIPVINYQHLLCECENFATLTNDINAYKALVDSTGAITSYGFQQISNVTEYVIETMGLSLRSGYLTNSVNRNSFGGSQQVAFVPTGAYSDGIARPLLNTDFTGASGIWTSTNPAVMYVDQQGNATALAAGTARISFVSFTGIHFSPFDVTVTSICPSTQYCEQP
jgi:hypothetical protein